MIGLYFTGPCAGETLTPVRKEAMAEKGFVYEGIKRRLKAQIENGELPEGSRVPSEYELARRLDVSRNQTRQALRELELEGYVVRRRGSGSYVAPADNRVVTSAVGRNNTVALVFPQYLSGYSRDVVHGFMERIATSGYQTIAYNVQFDEESEAKSLRAIAESGVSGLAVWIEHNNAACCSLIQELRQRGFPVVLIDRCLPSVDVDYVVADNVAIGYRLTKALIDRGHRRIAFIGSKRGNPSSIADRRTGYIRALEEEGISPDDRLAAHIREEVYDDPSVVVRDLMGLYDRPSAIFCLHDFVALLLYEELARLGYRLPEHVELAAVENFHPQKHDHVPMIVLEERGLDIGATSASLLLARLVEPSAPVKRREIEPTAVVENVVTAPKTRDQEVCHQSKGGEKHSKSLVK